MKRKASSQQLDTGLRAWRNPLPMKNLHSFQKTPSSPPVSQVTSCSFLHLESGIFTETNYDYIPIPLSLLLQIYDWRKSSQVFCKLSTVLTACTDQEHQFFYGCFNSTRGPVQSTQAATARTQLVKQSPSIRSSGSLTKQENRSPPPLPCAITDKYTYTASLCSTQMPSNWKSNC